jgi:uncharacterized membrane protein YgcG
MLRVAVLQVPMHLGAALSTKVRLSTASQLTTHSPCAAFLFRLQVPMQLGAAFTTAAQHSWKSPATQAALNTIDLLLSTACAAGILPITASPSSMGNSIRQQLQQSGALEQLAVAMAAAASELRREAALADLVGDSGGADVEGLVSSTLHEPLDKVMTLQGRLTELWGAVAPFADAITWLCSNSSAHAALHLASAVLQYVSSFVKYVLPAVRQRGQQRAEDLEGDLQHSAMKARALCVGIMNVAVRQHQPQQEGQEVPEGLQRLLLSPNMLPCVAAVLVVCASDIRKALAAARAPGEGSSSGHGSGGRNSREHGSSGGSGTSSSREHGSSGGTRQQGAPERSNSSGSAGDAFSPRQLQLLQLLGLTPEMILWLEHPFDLSHVCMQLAIAVQTGLDCCGAIGHLFTAAATESGRLQVQVRQRRQAQGQLWLLLQTVLLPCASDLLSLSAQDMLPPEHGGEAVQRLPVLCQNTLFVYSKYLEELSTPGKVLTPAAWMQELQGVLSLADQLLYQQSSTALAAEATSASAAADTRKSRCSSSSSSRPMLMARVLCAAGLLPMFWEVLDKSLDSWGALLRLAHGIATSYSSDSSDSSSSFGGAAAIVPPVAARFQELATALETTLRVVTAGVQSGMITTSHVPVEVGTLCSYMLLSRNGDTKPSWVQHMGVCGAAALAQEQRQLYSLLSTVLKMARCKIGGVGSERGGPTAGSCCLAAAQAAVRLLEMASPVRPAAATGQQIDADPGAVAAALEVAVAAVVGDGPGPAAAAAAAAVTGVAPEAAVAAAAAQQPAVDYLPSLVIFGRCCLQWAEQLERQKTGLLLLAHCAEVQQEQSSSSSSRAAAVQLQQESLLYELHNEGPALVCIPGLRQGKSGMPVDSMESLIDSLAQWVSGLQAPAVLSQLAAAGCAQQQLQQQLDALLAAQQGTRQGLTDASLAALVQQLRMTGRMLCGIAVPHFCNNAACGNLSGPTEVRLVSGRSCLCAGCLTARYCGRDCQRAAWKQHKPVCKALAAAAAAAAN